MSKPNSLSAQLCSCIGKAAVAISSNPQASKRIFHGRGQTLPDFNFLNIDWYAPVILLTLYSSIDEGLVKELVQELRNAFSLAGVNVEAIYVQNRASDKSRGGAVWGELPDGVCANEDGLIYELNFGQTQNIGFFPDMRPGRRWLRDRVRDKKVLNLFAYTCSFSVAAIAGGAHSVVNIDMSRGALNRGRVNHELNRQGASLARDVTFLAHDIFRSWGKLKRFGPYDLAVVDPPSMQKGSFIAREDYARVVRRIEGLLSDEGQVLFCLNSPHLGEDFLRDVIENNSNDLRFVKRLDSDVDFPEVDQTRNLKLLHYEVVSGAGISSKALAKV